MMRQNLWYPIGQRIRYQGLMNISFRGIKRTVTRFSYYDDKDLKIFDERHRPDPGVSKVKFEGFPESPHGGIQVASTAT